MRSLIAMAAAIVMLAGIYRQDARPFTMKNGSVMTYVDSRFDENGNGTKTEVTYTVVKTEPDKFFVDAKDGDNTAHFVFAYGPEYFTWSTGGDDAGMQVYKLGAKKGDSWKPGPEAPDEVKMTYEDDEQVTTPAGTFTAKRLVITAAKGLVKVSFWFSDKVGLVKASKEIFGAQQATIELQKFVEGK